MANNIVKICANIQPVTSYKQFSFENTTFISIYKLSDDLECQTCWNSIIIIVNIKIKINMAHQNKNVFFFALTPI